MDYDGFRVLKGEVNKIDDSKRTGKDPKVESLAEQLRSTKGRDRFKAFYYISRHRPSETTDISAVVTEMNKLAESNKTQVAEAIRMGWLTGGSVEAMVVILKELKTNQNLRGVAFNFPRLTGRTQDKRLIQPLVDVLAGADMIDPAAISLRDLGASPEAIKQVAPLLYHPHMRVRAAANELMRYYKAPVSAYVTSAIEAINTRDNKDARAAAAKILNLQPPYEEARADVEAALAPHTISADVNLRKNAVGALQKWGTPAVFDALLAKMEEVDHPFICDELTPLLQEKCSRESAPAIREAIQRARQENAKHRGRGLQAVLAAAAKKPAATRSPAETVDTFRTWTDSTGKHKIEAKFVDAKQGYILLHRRDGSAVSLPLNRLSEPDQKIAQRLISSRSEN